VGKFWNLFSSWEEAEKVWDQGAHEAAQATPLKKLKVLPQIPGITKETAPHLRWKGLKYLLSHDADKKIRNHILKAPFRYFWRYLSSFWKKKPYQRKGDFFLYGLSSFEEFQKKMGASLLVIGFSYCQKPLECPSGRFTDQCLRDPNHPVCRQCDIGKTLHALPNQEVIPLLIPTIHYIGDKIFEIVQQNPKREILFLITACELTLEMFGDLGNMAGIKGIGVRLDGRICNTMKAFELSEVGIKPGLTVVTKSTQEQILALLKACRSDACV